MQCLVDEPSGRSKHRFARQRTRFEGWNIVVEHIHGVVDEFLRDAHTAMVGRGANWVEVDRLLHGLGARPER